MRYKQINDIYMKIKEKTEYDVVKVVTRHSITYVLSDNDASFEEHVILDKASDTVYVVSEFYTITDQNIDDFYESLRDNWRELK